MTFRCPFPEVAAAPAARVNSLHRCRGYLSLACTATPVRCTHSTPRLPRACPRANGSWPTSTLHLPWEGCRPGPVTAHASGSHTALPLFPVRKRRRGPRTLSCWSTGEPTNAMPWQNCGSVGCTGRYVTRFESRAAGPARGPFLSANKFKFTVRLRAVCCFACRVPCGLGPRREAGGCVYKRSVCVHPACAPTRRAAA